MSARQAPVKAVRVYRDLLRTLRQHVTSNAQTTDWLQYVSAEFRRHQHVTDAAEVKRLLTTAQNYKEMLNAVADHQRLLLKYGWGVARSQRDEIERMVSRVGLRTPMPPEYMEYHEQQRKAELEQVREARNQALSEADGLGEEHFAKMLDTPDHPSSQEHASSASQSAPSTASSSSTPSSSAPAPSTVSVGVSPNPMADASDDFRNMFRKSSTKPTKP